MNKSLVILRSVLGRDLDDVVSEVMSLCGAAGKIGPGTRVLLKPNLCTERKDMIHTANTSFDVIEAVVRYLRELTSDITICESDGARYKVEQAFENNGIYRLVEKYGVKAVNLSTDEKVWVDSRHVGKWDFGKTFLETDVFITLPALKVHATTVFTGSLKNQWGCVPRRDRLIWHKYLSEMLADIAKLVPPRISLMDGIVGMQGRGPINGYPINANVLIGSEDPVAVDATGMRLIGLDPYTSEHVRVASESGVGRIAAGDIEIDGDFDRLRRAVEFADEDWAIKLLNFFSRSEFITQKIIMNDSLFYPIRRLVIGVRKL
ncbi:MAG TPA: DUF362 domain-containing protein, partial [Candidatus Krumholzibacterium sp.]|nr:DUF362 domain-containing protein [Candidatus Krumholzibacterium sp.]